MTLKGHGFDTQQVITASADGDLSAAEGKVVKLTSTGCTLVNATQGIGVLLNKPDAAGKLASIGVIGKFACYVDATTAIAAGDHLKANASGNLIKTTTAADTCNAIALEAKASGTGLITCLVLPHSI